MSENDLGFHYHDPFEELEQVEDDIDRAMRQLEKKADWHIPAAKREYIKELKRERRRRILDLLAPKRRCPYCKQIKIKSRSWVVLTRSQCLELGLTGDSIKGPKHALCRSCAMRFGLWKKKESSQES